MIQTLVAVLDAAAVGLKAATRHGLCEVVERDGVTQPCKYVGGKNLVPVITDKAGSVVYWRLTGPISSVPVQAQSVVPEQQVTVSLRMVALVPRADLCEDVTAVMVGVQNNVQTNMLAVRGALSLAFAAVDGVSVEVDGTKLWGQEVKGSGLKLPTDKTMVAMDVRLTLRAKAGCLPSCVEAVTVNLEQLNIN